MGEDELDQLVVAEGDPDGFEGNAQTFRVLTRLAVRFEEDDGLNLTVATLSASMKYPWFRDPADHDKSRKWSAYRTDGDAYEFARRYLDEDKKTAEAELMDWADDIAYSVHDIEDFHRANLIPWALVFSDYLEQQALAEATADEWWKAPADARQRAQRALERIITPAKTAGLEQVYSASRDQRARLRWWTSVLIGRYVCAARLADDESGPVFIEDNHHDEVRVLKQFAWRYVIRNPALAAQQHGQRRLIRELFCDLLSMLDDDDRRDAFPVRYRHLAEDKEITPARVVADCVSGLTESEALALHKRLRGTTAGTLLNPIIW